jgi:uncharacterized protein YhbP (UPF0306 family)
MQSPQDILEHTIYSTVATVSADGLPWAAPVFTVYDPKTKAMYWCASQNSQHGQNIKANNKVFIAVYDSMAAPGEGSGVYMRGEATTLTDHDDIATAHALLTAKHQAPYWSLDDLQPPSPIAVYKAVIQEAWVNKDHQEDGHFALYRSPIVL